MGSRAAWVLWSGFLDSLASWTFQLGSHTQQLSGAVNLLPHLCETPQLALACCMGTHIKQNCQLSSACILPQAGTRSIQI